MYRDNTNRLKEWKLNQNKKPLIFYGARQVGKTYLLQEFGKTEYRQLVYINFERAKEMQTIFLHDLDPKRLITALEFYSGVKKSLPKTHSLFWTKYKLQNEVLRLLNIFVKKRVNIKLLLQVRF